VAYKIFSHDFVRLTIEGGLHFYFFTLSKDIDDAQSFLGHVFSNQTLFSHFILFSNTYSSITGWIMINRRQL